jgi:hypothetical protein
MKHLDTLTFDAKQCQQELGELQTLLATHAELKEEQQIVPFFRDRRNLAAFLGSLYPEIIRTDRIAFEYDLFGDFSCDLVVGDAGSGAYGFIEFEDAAPNSIFVRRGAKSTPEWSSRFEHGYSQIIDWFYKLDDMARTGEFEARFGSPTI